MTVLLVILYILVCLFLVLVVLLQQGKGADLAGAFGGGGSQTSFGPRSRTNIMHRLTTVSFILFVVLSLSLAILSGKRGGSVMEDVGTAATETAPAVPVGEEPAGAAETLASPEEEAASDDAEPATDAPADDGEEGPAQPGAGG